MRTLIIGDLHFGRGARPNLFSGARALPIMLDVATASPTCLALNGDTFDLLSLAAPSGASDEQVMRMFVEDVTNRALLAALGCVLERGGSLLLRVGKHDAALADRGPGATHASHLEDRRRDDAHHVHRGRWPGHGCSTCRRR